MVELDALRLKQIEKRLDKKELKRVLDLAERLDFLDVQILKKFYMTGKEFPLDTKPFCFPILYREMKTNHHLKIGLEAFRKRLNNLVHLKLLEKVKHTNPTNYIPVKGKEHLVRATIIKFFVLSGMTKFL